MCAGTDDIWCHRRRADLISILRPRSTAFAHAISAASTRALLPLPVAQQNSVRPYRRPFNYASGQFPLRMSGGRASRGCPALPRPKRGLDSQSCGLLELKLNQPYRLGNSNSPAARLVRRSPRYLFLTRIEPRLQGALKRAPFPPQCTSNGRHAALAIGSLIVIVMAFVLP